MAPLSLKIVQGGGAITRTVLFDSTMRVSDAHEIVKEKVLLDNPGKEYGLFLTSADDELSGVWLEGHRTLDYYMLRDGDSLQYLCRTRNLRVRMLDGSEKTMQIDESKCVSELMMFICDKIGITNHEEYGLCFEDITDPQKENPAIGTLTLRKQQTREKDLKLEQLSKKLKTDDNVEWLDQHKTLRQLGVDPKETLLLKRRLFYSDRNVDSRDPVQLNLLYVQTRDAILDGRQVVTENKAVEFAGIQCQVQYGDYQEDKHKPGFIENLKEFLPEQYANSWGGVEKKVLKEHSKHQGLSPLEAKHLYTKTARELPTYGVTFFLVKEQQKGKKKLVPRLLGINAESILRLDEVTKEILQVWMLTQVKTFRAGKETFTLDFGDYSDKEYTVKTNEAHRIRDILQGYIDIIHRSLAAPFNVTPVEGHTIYEDNVQSSKGQIIQNIVPKKVVEHSYVGPSKLISYIQGSEATIGTQIMTVKQMLVTKKGSVQHREIVGSTGVGSSMEYLKKLKRLNSNSMETVEFLTDPNNKQEEKVQKVNALVANIEGDMNSIIEGVHKSVDKDNDEVKRKLLSELDDLCASFKALVSTSKQNDFGTPESLSIAQETAEKIVGVCTQMYCSLDPEIRKRSKILRRSHQSFIADERIEAKLRRASFLAAAAHACNTVDTAKKELDTTFEGSIPEGHEVDKLEREARKKIGKISAAIALLMSAQADPNNLDYSAAITSMTTIDELLPELIQDAKALGSVRDEKSRLSLLSKIKALCDAARNICSLTDDEDKEHMQELAYKYAKASDKLIFIFGRGTVADKENERSHQSFIADERIEAKLRRASFLAAAAHACNTVDTAKKELDTTFEGSIPEGHEVDKLEREARKKIGKISAAIALLMSAQADPNNLDYSAAITSMTTIDELLPELIQDAKALGSVRDEKSRLSLLSKIKALCDAARNICSLTDDEDKEHMQELAYKYAKASDKLIFIFGRGTVADKENEILDLAREVGDKTSLLLMKAHELIKLADSDTRAGELDAAGVRCADASQLLLACAQLTASSIDEPHCQSAMTAAIESLSSSAQHLAATWKPLVEEPGHRMFEESLLNHTMDLMKALDKLKEAYANLSVEENVPIDNANKKENDRLKFIATMRSAINNISEAQKDLDKPIITKAEGENIKELKRLMGQRLSFLNASIASLIRATADREHPDYDTAEQAIAIVAELMPELVRDIKIISATKDEKAGRALLNDIRALCEATQDISSASEQGSMQDVNDAASKFARFSSKLCYAFIPRTELKKENMIVDLSKIACEKASQLLTHVNQLVDEVGGDDGQRLDVCGAKLVDVVQALLTAAQITAPSFADPRCQSTMLSAADDVSSLSNELAATWSPLVRGPERQLLQSNLDIGRAELETALKNLRAACKSYDAVSNAAVAVTESKDKEKERLKFVTAMSLTNNKMLNAEKDLQRPIETMDVNNVGALQRNIAQRLAHLNAAIASLVRATTDPDNVDYSTAEQSISTITQLIPDVIQDTKSLSSLKDDKAQRAMLTELKKLFDATRDICKCTEQGNSQAINDMALKFAEATGKLSYVFNPQQKNDIPILSKAAYDKASNMVISVHELGKLVGGKDGSHLDECGIKMVNAAKSLLTTAQILASSIGDANCNTTLISAIDDVSACSQELTSAWSPIKQNIKHKNAVNKLEMERGKLNSTLNELRAACRDINAMEKVSELHKQDMQQHTPLTATRSSIVRNVAANNIDKELLEVKDLSKKVFIKAREMSMNARKLADLVGGTDGLHLDDCGERVADAAQVLYNTATRGNQSTEEVYGKYSLLAAIDAVSASSLELAAAWSPIERNTAHNKIIEELGHEQVELDDALKKMRASTKLMIGVQDETYASDEKTEQWLKYLKTMSDVKCTLEKASRELDKPVTDTEQAVKSSQLQCNMDPCLAQLNAATASLIRATVDQVNPNYNEADKATRKIGELIPDIIHNSNALSVSKDDVTRQNMATALKALCEATTEICLETEFGRIKNAYDPISKFAEASSKLCYVFNPRADMKRENLIVELSKSACDKASVLLSQVYQLAESTGGEEGAELDRNGAKVVDAAQSLLTTAEITASTIEDPHCQATLMSSADDVTSLLRQLADTWSTLLQDPKRKSLKDQLNSERSELESAIEELRTACKDASDVTLKPTKPVKPPPPKRTSLIYVDQKNLQEEKLKLAKSVDEAIKSIAHTENQIREMYNKKSVDTSVEAAQTASQQLERKLVLASVAASHLVFCNDPEKMNYKVADESVKSLSELFQTIVKDARELSNSHNLRAKSILDDTLGLCEATRALCGAAKDDRQKLNEIAVDFANKSAKLLYTIGTGVDPEQEKEVIARARVIGDCASRLTSCGAAGAQLAEDARAQALCVAASNCANAASNLLYITKLVAPSIQYPESQNILLTAADQLSGQVKQFLSSSTPLSSQQEEFNFVKDLEMEGENLERLLSDLKQDVKNENMVKRRKEEILMIEDSPMRQLASEILETYKTYVESSDLPMEERRNHAHDADKLSAAIKELDVANAHCRNSPQDASTLRRLENATQNLQQTLLQCHRGHGKEQSNIVDLMDYVQDVLSNIEMLSKTANETNGEHCKKQLQDIKDECDKMRKHATKLTNPTEPRGEGNLTDDLLLIDDFAQDCGKAVSRVYSYAKTVPDVQSRRQLEIKTHRLTDSVNILRFAVKSALATADSASLDECLHDLTELESRIDNMLQPTKILHTPQFTKEGSSAFAALCCAAASPHSSATTLTPALTTYVTEMRMRTNLNDPQEKHKLEAHLKKLLCLLKTLMMTTSRHTATWQEQDDGEVMTITDQVIQELENYEDVGSDREKQGYNIIDKVDVRRLLLPPTNKHLKGDKNELSKKLHQTSAKLNSLMGTITSSIQTPNTLSKSLHATAGAAIELATLARGLRNPENRLQSNQIEESARDMCFATFNLLKAAEKVSCEPDRPNSRWRLFDACRSLNDSINKLIRATDYRREGDELIRSLQLQQSFLQNLQPTCALNYEECVEALQNQSDVIYKLKSDQEMSHEEGIANLQYISSTVCNTSEYAAQCAYLISICDKYKIMAKDGLLDVTGLQKLIRSIQESCVRIICLGNISQAKDFESELNEKGRQLQDSINESKGKIEDVTVEKEMLEINTRINTDLEEFNKSVHEPNTDMITINTIMLKILDSLAALSVIINHPSIVPNVKELTMDSRSACHDVNNNSRELLNKTISLVKETNHSAAGIKSWATFDASRTSVLQAFDALMNSIRENGRRAGLLQSSQTEEEESEEQKKSYIAMQVDLAKNWLQSPTTNEKAKSTGIEGVNNVIKIANEMTEDLKGLEKDEMRQVIDEVEKLANECSLKYNKEKASLLLERLMELRKMLERVVVTRVVEDFLEDGTPLGDLDLLVDVEKDEAKRKYLLEQKIADLLAQMKRITRTARLVAGTGSAHVQSELTQHTQQVELLAPSLVKATQERINSPQHQEIIDNYKAVMAQYAESMSKVRILCDRSLDPVDFVQAAGETMQRMREEYSEQDDPLKSAHASNIITRLGQRVVDVGLGSRRAQQEPELRRALQRAQLRLQHAAPPTATLAAPLARTPQWTDLTAEILRTTGEVESALSGENIFQKQLDPNQPIFAAALDLHAAVREWSARDNEIVAVAKRMAVLMARLSDYMNHGNATYNTY